VNVRNLSVLFVGDDGFDTDEGYQGKGQFLFTILGQDQCGRGFEMDNDGSNMDNQPRSYPQFHNVTLIGPGGGTPANDGSDQMIRLREGTGGDFKNVIVAYGNGVGLRASDQATQALIGDSLLFSSNNIIYECSEGQFHSDNEDAFTAQDIDPQFRSVEGRESGTGIIDPRPVEGSPALTGGEILPDDGFFEQVNYLGAFGSVLWLRGWSLLDEQGRLGEVGVVDDNPAMATDFQLNAYPNPFNPQTSISFYLPSDFRTRIAVYNILGQEVKLILDRKLMAGSYKLMLDGRNLPSGIYFIQLETSDNVLMEKVTLLK
jgi:hypothetical protein